MKTTLEYILPEEREDLDLALNADNMRSALQEIRQKIFRPARKHGYDFDALRNLSERDILIIQLLEGMFYEIIRENNIENLDI